MNTICSACGGKGKYLAGRPRGPKTLELIYEPFEIFCSGCSGTGWAPSEGTQESTGWSTGMQVAARTTPGPSESLSTEADAV